ncbi:MAG TPA: AsmA-like C-terminal region-containing protein, partial [Caulobacteraceae bacterium]
ASLHLTLRSGLLTLDPVEFLMPHGTVSGHARIDARGAVPLSRVDFSISNMRIEDVLPRFQGAPPLEGPLEARATLAGAGDTVHKAAAASSGRITIALPGGQMRQSLAELMGVNVVPGLFQLLAKDPKQTPLRCAMMDFSVSHGVMTARQFVLDTGVVLTTGEGTIDLDAESLNLKVQGHTKKPRLVRIIAPFDVRGHLIKPSMKIETGPVIAQAGAAVGLAAVLSPLAAVLPFIATGGAHDADCAALLAQARSAGAPVGRAQLAAATPARH